MNKRNKSARIAPRVASSRPRQIWGIVRSMLFLAALVGLALWLSRLNSGTRVSSVVAAKALDDSFRPIVPTMSYSPGDTFFVSLKLEAYQPNKPVIARWKFQGQTINETQLTTQDIGDGFAGFSLSHAENNWPTGNYHVEIISNGQVLGSVSFEVKQAP